MDGAYTYTMAIPKPVKDTPTFPKKQHTDNTMASISSVLLLKLGYNSNEFLFRHY